MENLNNNQTNADNSANKEITIEYPAVMTSETENVEAPFGWIITDENGQITLYSEECFSPDAVPAMGKVIVRNGRLFYTENAPAEIEPDYQQRRAAEYPDFREYLDAQVKISSGDETLIAEGQTQLEAYYAACLAVKNKYPKPDENNKTSK